MTYNVAYIWGLSNNNKPKYLMGLLVSSVCRFLGIKCIIKILINHRKLQFYLLICFVHNPEKASKYFLYVKTK